MFEIKSACCFVSLIINDTSSLFWCMFCSLFQPMYESWFISLYTTLYTSLPIQCVGFFEQVSQILNILTNHNKSKSWSVILFIYIDSGIGRECQELSVLAGDLLHWTQEAAFQSFCSGRHTPLLLLYLHHPFLHTYGNITVLCSRLSDLGHYGGNVCGAHHHRRGN